MSCANINVRYTSEFHWAERGSHRRDGLYRGIFAGSTRCGRHSDRLPIDSSVLRRRVNDATRKTAIVGLACRFTWSIHLHRPPPVAVLFAIFPSFNSATYWPFLPKLNSIQKRLSSHFGSKWFFWGKNVALWARIWRAIMFWPTWHRRKENRRFNDCSHFKRKMKELSSSLATRMSSNFRKITKLKKNSSNFLSPSPTIATKSHQVPSSSPSPTKSHLSQHILNISSKNELEQQKFKLKGKRFFN